MTLCGLPLTHPSLPEGGDRLSGMPMRNGAKTHNDDRYQHAVGEIYGRVSEGASFIEVAGVVGNLFDCHIVGLHGENTNLGTSAVQISGPATPYDMGQLMLEYHRHWQGQNTWLHRGMARLRTFGFSDGDDTIVESELLQIPYYARFLSPLDIRHGVGFLLENSSNGDFTILSVNRPRSVGHFQSVEKAQLPLLLPHLRSAYRLSKRLQEERQTSTSLQALLNVAGTGVVLMTGNGTLCEINETARHAIEAVGCTQPLRKGAVLAFSAAATQERFLRALKRVHSNASGCTSFHAPCHRAPSVRHAVELLRMSDAKDPSPANICLLINLLDVSETGQGDEARLMQVFGFTASEALVVAHLVVLGSVEKVAQRLRISLPTVRTHIQHAFQKSGVSKQTELVLLAERTVRRSNSRSSLVQRRTDKL